MLMYVGMLLCCGLTLFLHMHAFRNVLKATFPEVDDKLHWVAVIIGIFGLYQNEMQLAELEKKYNIQAPASSMPWFLPIFCGILWPLALASQMKRLNALAEAAGK
jgi:hypothetical protein